MDRLLSEEEARTRTFDAVIIPGGGLDSVTGLPHPWVRARLDAALRLSSQTRYFIVLSRGTTHKPPPLDCRGFPILESAASAKYLLEKGVGNPERILLDGWSLDTIGNAYFAHNMMCQPMRLSHCCIITSAFHMPRTRTIFDWVFSLGEHRFQLEYISTPDVGLDKTMSSARVQKEKDSLVVLKEKTVPSIRDFEELSYFLFTQHSAYSAQAVRKEVEPLEVNHDEAKRKTAAVTNTY